MKKFEEDVTELWIVYMLKSCDIDAVDTMSESEYKLLLALDRDWYEI